MFTPKPLSLDTNSFDAQPCPEATLEDLDTDRFLWGYRKQAIAEEVIAANGRTLPQQLAGLRFYDPTRQCPTHAGVLCFGKKPHHFLAGAYVQFLKLAGNEKTSPVIDAKEIKGDLFQVLQTLDLLLDVNIRQKPVFISTLQETMQADYPKIALRELLLNAVMHRNYQSNTPIRFYWYQNHVCIENAGGLYGDAAQSFPDRNDYRNPILAEVMRTAGYVNRYGQGVLRAQRALLENGNPAAEFAMDGHWFSVTIREKSAV